MSDTSSGRQTKRTPVTLKIKFKSATLDQFIERYSVDVSQGGIFIRTKDPLAVGTQLRFEFQLQDASPLISGEGTVVWTREFDPSRVGVAPGMGVRFDKLGPESQPVLERILAQKHKDVAEPKFDGPPSQLATKVTPPALAGSLVAAARAPSAQGTPQSHAAVQPPRSATSQAAPPPVSKQTMLGYAATERPVPRVGHLAPPRGGFAEDPSKDATPLPKPMPFHAVADDEFSDDVFDQPTKVASLETLLKQEEEQARAARASSDTPTPNPDEPIIDDEDEVKTGVRQKPAPLLSATPPGGTPAAVDPPQPRAARVEPRHTPMAMAAQELRSDDEPRFLFQKEGEGRPAPRPRTPPSAPLPPPKSSMGIGVAIGAIALLAAAAAVYFFVLRPPSDAPSSRPKTTSLSPVVEPSKPPPPPPPAPAGVDVSVATTPPGATVEVDGKTIGTAPAQIPNLDPSRTYAVVAKAPCFKDATVELKPRAGTPVEIKLEPLDRVLRVHTDPEGANVSVNGKAAGKAPAEVKLAAAPPPQHVRATQDGYSVSEVTVPPDATCVTDGNVGVVNVKLGMAKLPEGRPAAAAPPPRQRPRPAVARPKPAPPKPKPPTPPAPETPVIVSPLQPLPAPVEEPKKPPETATDVPLPTEAPKEPPKEIPAEVAKDPPKEPPKEAPKEPVKEPPKEPAPPKDAPPKEAHPKEAPGKIVGPKEAPLPSKECDPSPDAPEWARCK